MLPNLLSRYKQLLPLLVLVAFSFTMVVSAIQGKINIDGQVYDYSLVKQQRGGLIAIVLNFCIYIFFKRYYKYSMLATILLGLFGVIIFSELPTEIGFSTNGTTLRFQPSAFVAGFLAILINHRRIINLFILKSENDIRAKSDENVTIEADEIEYYEKRYANYSSEDLNKILIEKKHRDAAMQAAQKVLDLRKSENK